MCGSSTAWGAASNGMRALCTVNHLGTNVIVDALKYTANYGVRGGLVLFAGFAKVTGYKDYSISNGCFLHFNISQFFESRV